MIPQKLKKGDEVRVIAPSRSMKIISEESEKIANKNLEDLGLKVSYGKNVRETDSVLSSSIKSRVRDIHEAFQDKKVKAIFTVIGGFNSNQLLDQIDWKIIKENPKIFCGYSDITVLNNAILAKTGLITYSGPHWSSFGMKKGLKYTMENAKKILFSDEAYEIKASDEWSNDEWYIDQEKRDFVKNDGYWRINDGEAMGKILGGNLGSLRLLIGTDYFPEIKEDTILFIEDCKDSDGSYLAEFDRNLQSLIQQKFFNHIKGIVIGRFEKSTTATKENVIRAIKNKPELSKLPVVANADFGHTSPCTIIPVGGKAEIKSGEDGCFIKILEH